MQSRMQQLRNIRNMVATDTNWQSLRKFGWQRYLEDKWPHNLETSFDPFRGSVKSTKERLIIVKLSSSGRRKEL